MNGISTISNPRNNIYRLPEKFKNMDRAKRRRSEKLRSNGLKIRRRNLADFLFSRQMFGHAIIRILFQMGAGGEMGDAGAQLRMARQVRVVLQNAFGGGAGFFHQKHVSQRRHG